MTYTVNELVLDGVLAFVSNTAEMDITRLHVETLVDIVHMKSGWNLLFAFLVHIDGNIVVEMDMELGVAVSFAVWSFVGTEEVDFNIHVSLVSTDEVTDGVASSTGEDGVGCELDVDVGIVPTTTVGAGCDVGIDVEPEWWFITLLDAGVANNGLEAIGRSGDDLSEHCRGGQAQSDGFEEMHLDDSARKPELERICLRTTEKQGWFSCRGRDQRAQED